MESGTTGIGRLDCYEDMFKEITRKLYGDDPDHRTSSVQNEFETSVSYKNDEDTGNGTDSDDGNWTCEEEPLKGTDGSRIAAYHAGKTTWRCYECGDCMTGGPREIAEHFMDLHASRILLDDSRNRHHLPRKDYLQSDLKLEDILNYLERVRDRAERSAPPSRRTQETQTVPAQLLPSPTTFLLQELPSTPPQQHTLHSNSATMTPSTTSSGKRYTCPYCPYGTDRRDLYTRHENIHREEKPFHCYVCYKPFNRADHVKKHFLRMHREHTYELARIRRNPGTNNSSTIKINQQDANTNPGINGTVIQQQQQQPQQQQQQQQHNNYTTNYNNNKNYQLQTTQASVTPAATSLYQTSAMTSVIGNVQENCGNNRRIQGCNTKGQGKSGSKGAQERRYSCCYCSWSGVDNWCLKRHLNTHLKPFACSLCEYKAARAERLATHVLKVHNKRQCSRCSFLGEDAGQLQLHQLHVHRINNGNNSNSSVPVTSSPTTTSAAAAAASVLTTPTPAATSPSQNTIINRHDGRPPPGPPVFPAPSAPVISSPPTTILGHKMVNLIAGLVNNQRTWNENNQAPFREYSANGRSRSRKQHEPRKVLNQRRLESDDMIDNENRKKIKIEYDDDKDYEKKIKVKNEFDDNNYLKKFFTTSESENDATINLYRTRAFQMFLQQPIEQNNIFLNRIKTEPSMFSLACTSGR